MVFKITDIRQQHPDLFPTFETEEEKLAYEKEQEKAYAEVIAQKVAELKTMYSDKQQYPKFSRFEDKDWIEYAKTCLKTINSTLNNAHLIGTNLYCKKPNDPKWARFTFEEIIQMENTGVAIPKEVLAWAHSIQDNDVTTYEIDQNSEETNDTGVSGGDSELANMKKETQKLSVESEKARTDAEQKFQEFKESSVKAEQIKNSQESTQKDSLKKIEDYTKEWQKLSEKLQKGNNLNSSEQDRYKELGSILNGKDGKLVAKMQTSSEELQILMNSINGLNSDIKKDIELGGDTTDAATQLAMYEKGYKAKDVTPNMFANVATGNIRDMLYGAQGLSVARNALDNGNNLIEFSNTLNDTLMMNQYASLYEFAQSFTEASSGTINETKEVMGEDFNKTTDELDKEADELPDMTGAETDREKMITDGKTLPEQARYFREASREKGFEAMIAGLEARGVAKEADKEARKSKIITKIIEQSMTPKKEEFDKLTEKKDKAEQTKQEVEQKAQGLVAPEEIEKAKGENQDSEEEFTETDKKKLDKLGKDLKSTGDDGQMKLYNSLTKIAGLEEFLKDKDKIALDSIDYGTITQVVGSELLDNVGGNLFAIIYLWFLAHSTKFMGEYAENIGGKSQEKITNATTTIKNDQAEISSNQGTIQNVTMSGAVMPQTPQEENQENTDTPKGENQGNKKTDEAPTNGAVTGGAANTNPQTQNIPNTIETIPGKGEPVSNDAKSPNKSTEKEIKPEDISNVKGETEKENADSVNKKNQTERTKEQLAKDLKILEKLMKKNEKELKKMVNESEKMTKEKEALAKEFEELTTKNEEIQNRQKSETQNKPVPENNKTEEQGGLLAPAAGAQQNNTGDDATVLDANATRMAAISTRFQAIDKKMNTNLAKIKTINNSSKKLGKTYEKTARKQERIIQENAKAEQEKQVKQQKKYAVVGIIQNIYSVILSVGTILSAIPWSAAVGAVMVQVGQYGLLQCALVKTIMQIADGNIAAAFMTMGMAIVQVAVSMVGAGGAVEGAMSAAQKALQITSGALATVSGAADMTANIQTAQGKQVDGWLNTVSQVAGAASALTGIAGGFVNGAEAATDGAGNIMKNASGKIMTNPSGSAFTQANTLGRIAQITSATGATISTTAQVSSIIKQAQGKETGDFENIMGIIGGSLSAAASLTQLGQIAFSGGGKEAREQRRKEKETIKATEKEAKIEAKATKQAEKKAQEAENAKKAEAEKATNKEKAGNVQPAKSPTPPIESKNTNPTELAIDERIAEIDTKSQQVNNSETGQEILAYNKNEEVNKGQNEPVVKRNENGVVSDEQRKNIDEKMKGEINPEKQLNPKEDNIGADLRDYNNGKRDVVLKEIKQKQRLENLDKAANILSKTGEAFKSGQQVLSTLDSLNQEDSTSKSAYNGPQSDMQKGRTLLQKIKKRKSSSMMNNKYA